MFERFITFGFLAASVSFGSMVTASTIGVTVGSIGSSTPVGTTEVRAALGSTAAIKYYIPLTDSGPCVYGVSCGTSSDSGSGGTEMSMFLRFAPVSTSGPSTLNINFEDLDLVGANDPTGFFESIEIFDALGVTMTGLIDDISNSLVSGDADTQQLLSYDLGVLPASVFYAEFRFKASYNKTGWNTPEYLIAEVIPTVPIPAAGLLLLGALGGLGFAGRRRQKNRRA